VSQQLNEKRIGEISCLPLGVASIHIVAKTVTTLLFSVGGNIRFWLNLKLI
jgi:hypothetical protein